LYDITRSKTALSLRVVDEQQPGRFLGKERIEWFAKPARRIKQKKILIEASKDPKVLLQLVEDPKYFPDEEWPEDEDGSGFNEDGEGHEESQEDAPGQEEEKQPGECYIRAIELMDDIQADQHDEPLTEKEQEEVDKAIVLMDLRRRYSPAEISAASQAIQNADAKVPTAAQATHNADAEVPAISQENQHAAAEVSATSQTKHRPVAEGSEDEQPSAKRGRLA